MKSFEQVLRETFDDASREAPNTAGEPPSPPVKPKRSMLPVLATAVVVAAVISTVAVVVHTVRDSDSPASGPPASGPRKVDEIAPPRDSLVGFRDVTIELPAGWALNDLQCGQPMSNTVIVQPSNGSLACAPPSAEGVSFVRLDDLDSSTASTWEATATEPFTLADGTPALRGWAQDGSLFETVVVVPDWDVIAAGTAPTPGTLDEITSRIFPLPSGLVSIPQVGGRSWSWEHASAQLAALGLVAERKDGRRGVVTVDPAPGRTVEIGTVVTLSVGHLP